MSAGAIASPHRAATDAGAGALAGGGNAFDAAISAAAVLGVVYPHMCALGGDVIALVREPGGETRTVNASGCVPARAVAPTSSSMPLTGPDTITVPGALAGLRAVYEAGAALDFSTLLEPAVEAASAGASVARSLARSIAKHRGEIAADPGLAAILSPGGRALAEGEELRQPALAETLRLLATDGIGGFYMGELGERFCAGIAELGSAMKPTDLAGFSPELVDPLRAEWRGLRVATAPPNSQGLALLQILGGLGDDDDAVTLARLFAATGRDRDRFLADPDFVAVPVERLLSDSHLADLREPHLRPPASEGESRADGDTVAVSAVDAEGRAVSLIMSVFHAFGAAILEPSTGILCHNRGASFSLDPDSPNRWEPGKRPAHTLMPVIVEGDGLVCAQGTMGGKAQPQIHAQLLLGRYRGLGAQACVGAPRFVVGDLDEGGRRDVVRSESDLDGATRRELEAGGLPFEQLDAGSEDVGHAQVAALSGSVLDAGSDPRADGDGAVVG